MKYFHKAIFLIGLLIFILPACDDDSGGGGDRFIIVVGDLNSDNYTGGGTLVFLFSTDNGISYDPNIPADLREGDVVQVAISNGTDLLTADDYRFDWSGSSEAPADPTAAFAIFTVTDNDITVDVTVSDIIVLVAIERNTGTVKSVNVSTGQLTDLFTFTLNSNDLTDIRGMIYHAENNKYYISRTANSGGELAEVDPATKLVTIINDNANSDWDGIKDMVVLSNGDLLVTIYDNTVFSNQALRPFATNGTPGTPIGFTNVSPCCGMGMTWSETGSLLIGDYPGQIHVSDLSGVVNNTLDLSADATLPTLDLDETYPLNLAWGDSDILYGIIRDESTNTNYIVEVDVATSTLSLITDLGSTRYHALAGLPSHLIN